MTDAERSALSESLEANKLARQWLEGDAPRRRSQGFVYAGEVALMATLTKAIEAAEHALKLSTH